MHHFPIADAKLRPFCKLTKYFKEKIKKNAKKVEKTPNWGEKQGFSRAKMGKNGVFGRNKKKMGMKDIFERDETDEKAIRITRMQLLLYIIINVRARVN